MANSANAVWVGSGPAFTFQQMAFGGADSKEMAYRGRATFTGDAASNTVTINFIDGTQTPFFSPGNPPTAVAPSMVIATASASSVASTWSTTVFISGVTSITTTGFVVQGSANFAATSYTIDFIVCP
jgi:hypothetical protein